MGSARVMSLQTHEETSRLIRRDTRRASVDPVDAPVLHARGGDAAERLARTFGGIHPAAIFVVLMLAGLATIALLSIAFGFLITRVLEPHWGIGAADERVNVWLAAHRTPVRTDASLIGSIMAGGVVLPIVAGVVAVVGLLLRKWRIAAFVVFALAVESASYRATTLVVHSHLPRVARLENLPVNASYPSVNTAASIAVYGGLALLITSRFLSGVVRVAAWTLVVAIVAFVATSRMYRGMHHPLDVLGGIAIGIAAVIALVYVCRTAGSAAERRDGGRR